MHMNRRRFLACSASGIVLAAVAKPVLAAAPSMTVYKDPNCGCCHLWAEAMQKEGFEVRLHDVQDLAPERTRLGVPVGLEGCHVAEMEGYFLDGHVPLSSVKRILAERPALKGLAVPGMPSGSLGMGHDPAASYDVLAVPTSGPAYLFEAVRPRS